MSLKPLTSRKQFLCLLVQGRVESGHTGPVILFLIIIIIYINEGWQEYFMENLSSSSLYPYCSYLIKYSHQYHQAPQYNLQQYVSFCLSHSFCLNAPTRQTIFSPWTMAAYGFQGVLLILFFLSSFSNNMLIPEQHQHPHAASYSHSLAPTSHSVSVC